MRASSLVLSAKGLFPLLRPAMVAEYAARDRAGGEEARWRIYRYFTYALSLGVALFVASAQEYAGTSRGGHILTGYQRWTRETYAGLVTGVWGPPPALPEAGEAEAAGPASGRAGEGGQLR